MRHPCTKSFCLALFVSTMVFVTWTLWEGERDSCLRQTSPRAIAALGYRLQSLRAIAAASTESGKKRNIDLYFSRVYTRLQQLEEPLRCTRLIPQVGHDPSPQALKLLHLVERADPTRAN